MQHKLFEDSSKLILNIKKEGLKLNENAENFCIFAENFGIAKEIF